MAQPALPTTKAPPTKLARSRDAAQARQRPGRDLIETVWVLFCSVKFAVVLNIALAFTTMLGTVIPQIPAASLEFEEGVQSFLLDARGRYGDLTGLLNWAGFFDLYNSLWFRMLVVIVVFSIIICTLNRWQPTMRLITRPTVRVGEQFLAGLRERANFRSVPLGEERVAAVITQALKKSRYRVVRDQGAEGALHLYADRDRWSKLVTFVSHAALVLLILTAAGMTQLGWRERSVYFPPGKQVDVGHGTTFKVSNIGWEIEYYPDGRNVKEFRNTLAVFEGGAQVLTKTIIVNDPLRYKDINFFLVSYLPVLYVRASEAGGRALPLNAMGATGPLTATAGSEELQIDFQFTSDDNLPLDYVQLKTEQATLTLEVTYYQNVKREPGENPPAYARAYVGKEFEKPVFDGFIPRTGPLVVPGYEQYAFSFRQDTATVLEVAQDPGLGWVGLWFTIMTLGFTTSLYTTFTRCWVRITAGAGGEGVDVAVGGLAEKNKVAFERDFEKLALRIQDRLSRET